MRLVSWNCNRAFGRKIGSVLALDPDVLVVQECEHDLAVPAGFTYVWIGTLKAMGLGILARDPHVRRHVAYDDRWTLFLPVELPTFGIHLLATWAFHHRATSMGSDRVGRLGPVLDVVAPWLASGRSVMAGDFNHHPRWDTPRGKNNFADTCRALARLGLRSAYHIASGETHGAETRNTHFLYRKPSRPYHIDYCFVHESLRVRSACIPHFDAWAAYSDHVPMIVDLDCG